MLLLEDIQDPRLRRFVECARIVRGSDTPAANRGATGMLIVLFDELRRGVNRPLFLGSPENEVVQRLRPVYNAAADGAFEIKAGRPGPTDEECDRIEGIVLGAIANWERLGSPLVARDGLLRVAERMAAAATAEEPTPQPA